MAAQGFMVRDRSTGLFRTKDGTYTKVGKIWRRLGHLKLHLNGYRNALKAHDEVIVLVPMLGTNIPITQIFLMKEGDLLAEAAAQVKVANNVE